MTTIDTNAQLINFDSDSVRRIYTPRGLAVPYSFNTIYELTFDNGRLIEISHRFQEMVKEML